MKPGKFRGRFSLHRYDFNTQMAIACALGSGGALKRRALPLYPVQSKRIRTKFRPMSEKQMIRKVPVARLILIRSVLLSSLRKFSFKPCHRYLKKVPA